MSEFMNMIVERSTSIWDQAYGIWVSGGWAMIAIAMIALSLFGMGMHVHFKLRGKGYQSVPEKTWRRWIDDPAEGRGPIGDLITQASGARSIRETTINFEQMRNAETSPFERDLKVMRICVSAAPLVGLLGTVTGMLATFGALASGSGGDKTMGMVASGISEALITTETGLVIALPGLFFQYQLIRRLERYKTFLGHLETVCVQKLHGRLQLELQRHIRTSARKKVVGALYQRLRRNASPSRVHALHARGVQANFPGEQESNDSKQAVAVGAEVGPIREMRSEDLRSLPPSP